MLTAQLPPVQKRTQDVANPVQPGVDRQQPKERQRPPIGILLKSLRGDKTLRKVEADTGITNPYLSNIELGIKKPGIKILAKLSIYHQVPLEHLLHVAGIKGKMPQPADKHSPMDIRHAYDFVVTDPELAHCDKPETRPLLDAQKYIVRIYEQYTGRRLL